jgi:hypothetical protein
MISSLINARKIVVLIGKPKYAYREDYWETFDWRYSLALETKKICAMLRRFLKVWE